MGLFDNLIKAFSISDDVPRFAGEMPTEEDLLKSERVAPSKSIIEDPMYVVNSLGFKDKPSSLTYDTLKRMATRNSVVSAILVTRINQVSSFSQPSRFSMDSVGFQIRLRDPKGQPTEEQRQTMIALESFIENCGYSHDPGRDDFDTFLRKILRDSLMYDQMCFEIVPDRLGRPAEFHAVDASTIRAGVMEPDPGDDYITNTTEKKDEVDWVQVIDGKVVTDFTSRELAFAVRNPRTDINIQPYGLSELETLIHQITAHLWAEEYNSRYFSQGGTTKGILNLKGQNISKEQLDAFRRQWTAQIAGITGAWKTPVVSVDGLEYINVSQSNREMEYEMWMNYLINIVSAVYQIDPAEINFPNRGGSGGGSGGGLGGDGGMEDKLKNSKDKGLRPLLRFVESTMNRSIIRRFGSEYVFNFVGLDKESESEKLDLKNKQVRMTRTVNEMRRDDGLSDLEHGDIILDPVYLQYVTAKQQEEMMAQQGDMMGEEGMGEAPEEDEPTEEGTAEWEGAGDMSEEELREIQEESEKNDIDESLDSQ